MESHIEPRSMTVLCTYQCTAACKQCCFESSPKVKGRLDGSVIRARITEAHQAFPSIRVVVFSGGEAFLLKDELSECVAHAASLGLSTRIVSNGSWAKRPERAKALCEEMKRSGLHELNLSTGKDHQEFVPEESIINACEASIACNITTLVTIETDTKNSDCCTSLRSNPRIKELLKRKEFTLITNFWMPFHADASERKQTPDIAGLRKSCPQVFDNVVITPHDNLSACCGLTLEHIPEMRLAKNDGRNLGEMYRAQSDDFMKYWLKVEGPYSIIEKVMGDKAHTYLDGVVHMCQACAILHKTPEIRSEVIRQYPNNVSQIMTRFAVNNAVDKIQRTQAERVHHEA